MDFEKKVENYLKEQFGPGVRLKGMERRGKGTHGTGYLLTFTVPGEEKQVIMKSLSPSGFGHDHYSDRAQALLLAHSNYNEMDMHIKALDVVGDSPDRLISLKEAREFYIFMEKATGADYFKDLNAVLEHRRLSRRDREKAQRLARFAAGVHHKKYTGEQGKTLYRRRIRDLIGHGECIMGIIDAYNGAEFTSDEELVEYAKKSLTWWGKIRNRAERLCDVHGDFHPGNIWFKDNDLILLDRRAGHGGKLPTTYPVSASTISTMRSRTKRYSAVPLRSFFMFLRKPILKKRETIASSMWLRPFLLSGSWSSPIRSFIPMTKPRSNEDF
jgi:hypothetical protein